MLISHWFDLMYQQLYQSPKNHYAFQLMQLSKALQVKGTLGLDLANQVNLRYLQYDRGAVTGTVKKLG